MRRNGYVKKAEDLIKKDAKSQGKKIETDWRVGNNGGKRSIMVDGNLAFSQEPGDLSGSFQGEFSHLAFF